MDGRCHGQKVTRDRGMEIDEHDYLVVNDHKTLSTIRSYRHYWTLTAEWHEHVREFGKRWSAEMIDRLRMSGGIRRDWHHVLLLSPCAVAVTYEISALREIIRPLWLSLPSPGTRARSPFNIACHLANCFMRDVGRSEQISRSITDISRIFPIDKSRFELKYTETHARSKLGKASNEINNESNVHSMYSILSTRGGVYSNLVKKLSENSLIF